MTKEQWKTVLNTINVLDASAHFDVPDEETEFWKVAEDFQEKLAELKSTVEFEMEDDEENPN